MSLIEILGHPLCPRCFVRLDLFAHQDWCNQHDRNLLEELISQKTWMKGTNPPAPASPAAATQKQPSALSSAIDDRIAGLQEKDREHGTAAPTGTPKLDIPGRLSKCSPIDSGNETKSPTKLL